MSCGCVQLGVLVHYGSELFNCISISSDRTQTQTSVYLVAKLLNDLATFTKATASGIESFPVDHSTVAEPAAKLLPWVGKPHSMGGGKGPADLATAGKCLLYGVWKASRCDLRGPKFKTFSALCADNQLLATQVSQIAGLKQTTEIFV